MQYKNEPIAIVGLSSLFPDAENLQQFWSNIFSAKDAITDVPETHWKVEDYYDADPNAEDKTYCKRGGFIPKTPFSPVEFGIPPNALDVIDVLQLLSLNVAKSALFDADYLENDRAAAIFERTGVVLGITGANSLTQPLSNRLQSPKIRAVLKARGLDDAQIEDVVQSLKKAYAPWEENSFPGMLGNVVAGRVANRFDFGGINCTVDAACASSLAALRMSIDELHSGRADMMLTGGCDAENTILMYMCFSKTPAFSKRGIISPFDEASDGTLIGEGIGMLALKRLSDAERDGDKIYSVIKGLGASSDGKFKSIYAPRKEGQIKCLKRAYEDAGTTINTVGLIEAHGTGTKVGDATEISALHETIGAQEGGSIAIGTVKSQIGHTKAAAGAAGLIKAALSLHHKILPPTININKPAESFTGKEQRLYINNQARPWLLNNGADVRRAGISSFGFGGTNFHAVLEEYNGNNNSLRRLHHNSRPVMIAANSVSDLLQQLDDAKQAKKLSDLPFQQGSQRAVRLGFTASSITAAHSLIAQAVAQLNRQPGSKTWGHPKGIYFSSVAPQGKVAALFSGQGSQYINMGQSAAMHYPEYINLLSKADEKMFSQSGEYLSDKVYPVPSYDDATTKNQQKELTQTRFAQPAIGMQSAAAYRTLQQSGFSADFVAGHSFGELTAMWAAEALSDDDYISLAIARGAAMSPTSEQNESGTMAAVSASGEKVEQLIAEHGLTNVYLCNYNTPMQTVIGGTQQGIDAFTHKATALEWNVKQLPVSAAFHTPLVAHAQSIFEKNIDAINFTKPTKALYRNKDGQPINSAEDLKSGLKQQILEPVRFTEQIKQLRKAGVTTFVEFGPKGHLCKMVGEILKEEANQINIIAVDNGQAMDSANGLVRSIVQLAVAGLDVQSLDEFEPDYQDAPARPGFSVDMYGINYVSENRHKAWVDSIENPDESWQSLTQSSETNTVLPATLQENEHSIKVTEQQVQASTPVQNMPETQEYKPTETTSETSIQVSNHVLPATSELTHQGMIMSDKNTSVQNASEQLQMLGDLQQNNASLHSTYLNNVTSTTSQTIELLNKLNTQEDKPSLLAIAQQGLELIAGGQEQSATAHQQYLRQTTDLAVAALGTPTEHQIHRSVGIEQPVVNAIPETPQVIPEVITKPVEAVVPMEPVDNKVHEEELIVAEQPQSNTAVTVNSDDVLKALITIVAEKTGYPEDVLDPSMDIEADLGIDSIKRVEILGALQSSLPNKIEIKPEQASELKTLADFASVLGSASAAATSNSTDSNAVTSTLEVSVSAVDIQSLLLEVVSDKTGYPQDVLELQMDMEADLGIDSIKRVEILGDMQSKLPENVKLDPHALSEARSLEDIILLSSKQLANQSGEAAPAGINQAVVASAQPAVAEVGNAQDESVEVNSAEMSNLFLQIVSEKTGYPEDVLEMSMRLEADLGIDSIKRVEILGELQNQMPKGVQHDPAALGELETLGDIVTFISNKPADFVGIAEVETEAEIVPQTMPSAIKKHQVILREIAQPTDYIECFRPEAHVLLITSEQEQSQVIKSALEAKSFSVSTLSLPSIETTFSENHYTLDNWNEQALVNVLEQLPEIDAVIFPHMSEAHNFENFDLNHQDVRSLKHLLLIAKFFKTAMDQQSQYRKAFIALTRVDGKLGLSDSTSDFLSSGCFGLIKTLAMETEHLFCRTLDASPEMSNSQLADVLLAELFDSNVHLIDVGVTANQRFSFDIVEHQAEVDVSPLTQDTCFIVTGGAKGITASCIAGLAAKQPGNYVLLGRSQLNEEEASWSKGVPDKELKIKASEALKQQGEKVTPKKINALVDAVLSNREIYANLQALQNLGVKAKYVSLDISDAAAVEQWVKSDAWLKESPSLALIHGAGALADKLIEKKQLQEFNRVFNAKLIGLTNLLAKLDLSKLVFSCHFSSVAGLFGNIGQVDYAMANEILNRMTLRLQKLMPQQSRTASIIWGAWNAGMVTPQIKEMFESRGVSLIEVDEGVEHFVDTCISGAKEPLVMVGPSSGLSSRSTDFKEFSNFSAEIKLHTEQLATSGVLAAHAIDGKTVMPLTFAMGWVARNIEHLFNQAVVIGCEKMHINSGIVMDETMPKELILQVDVVSVANSQSMTLAASIKDRHSPKVYYTFDNMQVDQSILQQQQNAIEVAVDIDASQLYEDKTLFHKDEFQLLRSYNDSTAEEMLFTCQWQPQTRHHLISQHTSKVFCPMYADALLQAALVWVRKKEGLASLPMRLEELSLYKPINDGEKLYIRVGEVSRSDSNSVLSLVALRADGQVHLVMKASVVKSAALANKFEAS